MPYESRLRRELADLQARYGLLLEAARNHRYPDRPEALLFLRSLGWQFVDNSWGLPKVKPPPGSPCKRQQTTVPSALAVELDILLGTYS